MASHWKPRSTLRAAARKLADLDAEMYAPGQFRCDVAADCSNPRYVEVSYTDQVRSRWRTWRGNVEYTVPCRICDNCRRRRRRHWTARIRAELDQATRSWFGTLTLSPENHFRQTALTQMRLKRQGVLWDHLDENDKFRETVATIGEEITLFFKRVRKNSGAIVRYCLVAERHKSGLPHFHVVVHHAAVPVLHKHLARAWPLGFSDFRLVDDKGKAARYVAKYLTKALATRVRSSARYGYITASVIAERLERERVKKDALQEANKPAPLGHCRMCGSVLGSLHDQITGPSDRGGLPKEQPSLVVNAGTFETRDDSSDEIPVGPREEVSGDCAPETSSGSEGSLSPWDPEGSFTLWAKATPVCPRRCIQDAPVPASTAGWVD